MSKQTTIQTRNATKSGIILNKMFISAAEAPENIEFEQREKEKADTEALRLKFIKEKNNKKKMEVLQNKAKVTKKQKATITKPLITPEASNNPIPPKEKNIKIIQVEVPPQELNIPDGRQTGMAIMFANFSEILVNAFAGIMNKIDNKTENDKNDTIK